MTKAVKSLFGGSDDSAQGAQVEQNAAAQRLIAENVEQARGDVLNLFPAADVNRNLGFQGALDVFGQGNVTAQQQLLTGLPQIQNAILGRPVDLSGLQAQTLPAQLPQFTSSTEALEPSADLSQLLRGF